MFIKKILIILHVIINEAPIQLRIKVVLSLYPYKAITFGNNRNIYRAANALKIRCNASLK